MNNRYMQEMDQLHAPKNLVEATQAAVRAEQRRRGIVRWRSLKAVAVAAAVCLGVWAGAAWLLPPAEFTQVDASGLTKAPQLTLGRFDPERKAADSEAFDAAMGTEFAPIAQNAKGYLTRELDGTVKAGALQFDCTINGLMLAVQCSQNAGELPSYFENSRKETIRGASVWFVQTDGGYSAGITRDELLLLVTLQGEPDERASQRDFRKAVADLIERLT